MDKALLLLKHGLDLQDYTTSDEDYQLSEALDRVENMICCLKGIKDLVYKMYEPDRLSDYYADEFAERIEIIV